MPTPAQEETLRQWVGATRFVYNLALEQRRDYWRQYRAATGGSFSFVSQGRQVTDLRREVDWIRDVPSGCLCQALRDLDSAFTNFFSGRSRFPTMRRRGVNDCFRVPAKETRARIINARWGEVRLARLGWVRFRFSRAMAGRCLSATFGRDALGWHVSFVCEIEHEAPANDNPAIGIDRGIATSLALSNGEGNYKVDFRFVIG